MPALYYDKNDFKKILGTIIHQEYKKEIRQINIEFNDDYIFGFSIFFKDSEFKYLYIFQFYKLLKKYLHLEFMPTKHIVVNEEVFIY